MVKRLILVVVALAVLGGSSAALAYDAGRALPDGATETEVWEQSGSGWTSLGAVGGASVNARAWTSGPASGTCNKKNWPVTVKVHASVAQWIEWTLSGTRWDWRIRKPGTYATDCITFTIKSNNDVLVDYEEFEDLQCEGTSVNPTIPVWYAFGPGPVGTLEWIPAADLNSHDDMILDSAGLHGGLSFKLWNKIEVVACNSSCEYHDDAKITLVLQNVKHWIDESTGNYKNPQE